MRLRKLLWIPILLLAIILAAVISVALQVDDWRRDLSNNVAESSQDAADPALRPIDLNMTVDEAAARFRSSASSLPRWQFIDLRPTDEGGAEIHFTRTTRLFRFVDDIIVTLRPTEAGCRATLRSQSRIGKGDLGQNPRNIKELAGRVLQAAEKAN